MKLRFCLARLCKAGQQLREQIDDAFPDRDRTSDGWIGDARHAARKSDHNPDVSGVVRAIDIDADLRSHASEAFDLADQLRILARTDKRIAYIIFNGKIASWRLNYKWRPYKGINPHKKHIHVSFTKLGDTDGGMFYIPLLTGDVSDKNRAGILDDNKIDNSSSTRRESSNCPLCQGTGLHRGK